MRNDTYNLKNLFALGDVNQLVIPEVQRDYVWEERNCKRLYHSILISFDRRKYGMPEYINTLPDENVRLTLENNYILEKSRVNLGFIYAYHDSDYIGKLFLIDGQQRFTTIFLMLLAGYVKLKEYSVFTNLYFKNNIPKLDYKVREASHDFLIELIVDQCNGYDATKFEERLWWRPDFNNDVTILHFISNYAYFLNEMEKVPHDKLSLFIQYLENNVDFKFFDVAVSEQGEQLYLFMNSRGIRLSFQEKIRAEIIANHGLECGDFWEEAQQYFWENKGTNIDAENGFNEFLKWCVIIDIAVNGKDYITFIDYITRPTTDSQTELFEAYILDNIEAFSKEFLEGIFEATKIFFNINSIDSILNNSNWQACPDIKVMPTVSYLKFLPAIYYIYRKKETIETDKNELRRIAAFIVNNSQSRTYQKTPQLSLLNFIFFIKELCDNRSIISIMDFDYNSKSFIGRAFSKFYFKIYNSCQTNNDKYLLEDFVIKIIMEAETSNGLDYLHGNYRLILKAVPQGTSIRDGIPLMQEYCNKLQWFIKLDHNKQRKLLLTFGDYSYPLNDIKYDYGQDKLSWGDVLTNEDKVSFFSNFLNEKISLDESGLLLQIQDWENKNSMINLIGKERYLFYFMKYNFNKNFLAWGWGINQYIIRTHSVRKTGYNTSIDIINYTVVKSKSSEKYKAQIIHEGWVYGSSELSVIKIGLNNRTEITMNYIPFDWENGNWILTNNLSIIDPHYINVSNAIQSITKCQITSSDDIVELGRIILKDLIDNLQSI